MASVLVHLATGPENPTRAALALLVARTAADEGHDVSVFLAGDAVGLLRNETAEAATGIGTGNFGEHLDALRGAGVPIFASGMSSKARGLDPSSIDGVEPAQPQKLVELATACETTLSY
jgi:predicted peroxiredoxin